MANCSFHPLKFASGICIRCRRLICPDCSTQLDGINYCRLCLEFLSARKVQPVAPRRVSVLQVMLILVFCLLMYGLFWWFGGSLSPEQTKDTPLTALDPKKSSR